MAESTHSRASRTKAEAEAEPEATPTVEAQPQDTGTEDDPGELALPVGQLVSDSDALLGHPVFVASAALAGHAPDSEMTIGMAKNSVETWLQTPVKVDPASAPPEEEG